MCWNSCQISLFLVIRILRFYEYKISHFRFELVSKMATVNYQNEKSKGCKGIHMMHMSNLASLYQLYKKCYYKKMSG